MKIPLLYRQLQDQLSQWVQPKDQRHLQGLAEIVAAVLQSGKACLVQSNRLILGLGLFERLME